MLYPNPHMQLMGALQFSAFDLFANQERRLSPDQRKQIEARRNQSLIACAAAFMLVWAVGLLIQAPLLLLLFLTAAIVSVFIALWVRASEDLESAVESVTGNLERFSGAFPQFQQVLKIHDQQFRVSRPVSEAFSPGRLYRLYFTPGSHTLLSAEMLN